MKRIKSILLLNFVLSVNLVIAIFLYLTLENILLFLLAYILLLIPVNTIFLYDVLNKTDYVVRLSNVLVLRFPNNRSMRLHLVSHYELFKLLFKRRKSKSIKRFIYSEIIYGVFALQAFLEQKNYLEAEIVAISYFFNKKTMEKMGFVSMDLDMTNKIRFFSDFPLMLLTNLLIYKKVNITKVRQVRKGVTNYSQLSSSLQNIKKQYIRIGEDEEKLEDKPIKNEN